MAYVDGFVIAVPRNKMKTYVKMAREGKKMWMKLGALDYKECVADDIKAKWATTPFATVMKLKPGETVVLLHPLQVACAPRSRQRKGHADDEGAESADRHALRHEADDLRRIQSHRLELA